jgi:hypothetical protein
MGHQLMLGVAGIIGWPVRIIRSSHQPMLGSSADAGPYWHHWVTCTHSMIKV